MYLFPRASERRVLLIVGSVKHFHIFSSSHLHTFSSSHLLIFTSSHLLILTSFTSSHLHISSSHLLTSSHIFSHLLTSSHIFSSSHLHIFSHLLTSSHIFSSSHLLIFTSSHIFSSSHLLIFTSSHLHILSCSLALLLSCPLALSFFPIALLRPGVPGDPAPLCVGGVALGDIDVHSALQAWHFWFCEACFACGHTTHTYTHTYTNTHIQTYKQLSHTQVFHTYLSPSHVSFLPFPFRLHRSFVTFGRS